MVSIRSPGGSPLGGRLTFFKSVLSTKQGTPDASLFADDGMIPLFSIIEELSTRFVTTDFGTKFKLIGQAYVLFILFVSFPRISEVSMVMRVIRIGNDDNG